jgi:lactoylglutathione lyase
MQFKFPRLAIGIILFAIVLPYLGFSQAESNSRPVFNHAALCARDLRKTTAFYTTILRLQKISNPFNDTLHTWLKMGPGLALHIIKADCPPMHYDISLHLCFSVPSLYAFVHRLDRLNVKYGDWVGTPKKITLRPDGVHQIYFQDPDGFWIEVNDAK